MLPYSFSSDHQLVLTFSHDKYAVELFAVSSVGAVVSRDQGVAPWQQMRQQCAAAAQRAQQGGADPPGSASSHPPPKPW